MSEQVQNSQPVQAQPTQPQQPAQGNKSNTALKVVLGILGCCLVLVIVVGVAGALFARTASKTLTSKLTEKGVESVIENQIEKETGKKIDIDTNFDEGKFEVKGDDGSTFSVGDSKLPEGFPTDVPLYDGAKVVSSSKSSTKIGNTFYMAVLSTSDDVDTVNAYYKSALEDAGWKEESTYNSSMGSTVTSKKGNTSLTVYMYQDKAEKTTAISLTVSENKE